MMKNKGQVSQKRKHNSWQWPWLMVIVKKNVLESTIIANSSVDKPLDIKMIKKDLVNEKYGAFIKNK